MADAKNEFCYGFFPIYSEHFQNRGGQAVSGLSRGYFATFTGKAKKLEASYFKGNELVAKIIKNCYFPGINKAFRQWPILVYTDLPCYQFLISAG